jgi:UDP:flavonoid glycosyltransferase YjiC (YdhE family)
MRGMLQDGWEACQGVEAMVFSPMAWYVAGPVMEKLHIPGYPASLQPFHPTVAFPNPYFPQLHLGRLYNRLSFTLADQLVWRLFRGLINTARAEVLNLAPLPHLSPLSRLRQTRIPMLYGYSPTLVPHPADWGDWLHVTGYWFLDAPQDWNVPEPLRQFLEAGPPPVYVGFGSTSSHDPEQTTRLVVKALQLAGQRGILGMGWNGMTDSGLPENILSVDFVPHEWLMPRVSVTVHHGGAGTSAAGLRAGRPTVTVPFFADQPFWSRCVYEAGAGPKPLDPRTLTPEHLAEAILLASTDRDISRRAAALGARIRAEEGVNRAVEILNRLLGQSEGGLTSRK